jgi:hypothetical protein
MRGRLQRLVLRSRSLPGAGRLHEALYELGEKMFIRFVRSTDSTLGGGNWSAIYLRRGAGRGETVPGASDLDFFLVLSPVSAEREMELLKRFWTGYRRLKLLFPFYGEVLMGDSNELLNWLESPAVRACEARHSWRLLWGREYRGKGSQTPDLRDLYSEALKCYWELLQPVVKLRPEHFHSNLRPHDPGAVQLRHGAKAALDLFRLHRLAFSPSQELWQGGRLELMGLLPTDIYGTEALQLKNLLLLRAPLLPADPLALFSGLCRTACHCLHEIALLLGQAPAPLGPVARVKAPASEARDPYSLSVRELFAERMLLRHEGLLSRALLSVNTTHIYFPLHEVPDDFRPLLEDLRDVNFSFDRFSVAMPLTEAAFLELERSSVMDTPFHSCEGHREVRHLGEGAMESRRHQPDTALIPESMLLKTFAELSFRLRLQPEELDHFLEKTVSLVLGLRLVAEHREISGSLPDNLHRYGKRYPLRVQQLRSRLAPYLATHPEAEEALWEEIFGLLDCRDFPRAQQLRSQFETIRKANNAPSRSRSVSSDAWINLTPFLRMEMNTMKERYFRHRPPLKL